MLKDLPPLITGPLLQMLADLEPGERIAITGDTSAFFPTLPTVTVNAAADALLADILEATAINPDRPLLFWATDAEDARVEDLLQAARGLSRDAGATRTAVSPVTDSTLLAEDLSDVRAVARVPWQAAPFVLILRTEASPQANHAYPLAAASRA